MEGGERAKTSKVWSRPSLGPQWQDLGTQEGVQPACGHMVSASCWEENGLCRQRGSSCPRPEPEPAAAWCTLGSAEQTTEDI